ASPRTRYVGWRRESPRRSVRRAPRPAAAPADRGTRRRAARSPAPGRPRPSGPCPRCFGSGDLSGSRVRLHLPPHGQGEPPPPILMARPHWRPRSTSAFPQTRLPDDFVTLRVNLLDLLFVLRGPVLPERDHTDTGPQDGRLHRPGRREVLKVE